MIAHQQSLAGFRTIKLEMLDANILLINTNKLLLKFNK